MKLVFPLWQGALVLGAIAVGILAGSAAADSDNDPGNATAVTPGIYGPYDIDPAGDNDWFTFTLNATSLVRIELNGSGGGDSTLVLYDANESFLYYDDDGGVGLWSRLFVELAPGTYYVVAADLSNYYTFYGYYLTFEVVTAVELTPGTHGPYDLSPGQNHWYNFSLSETASVRIATSGNASQTGIGLYSGLAQYSLYETYASGTDGARILIFLLPGDYSVAVYNYWSGGAIVGYTLEFDVAVPEPIADGPNGPFTESGDAPYHLFSFSGANDTNVRLSLDAATGTPALQLLSDSLYLQNLDYLGNGTVAALIYATVYPGNYYVAVTFYYDNTPIENYTLTLTRAGPEGFDGNDLRDNATALAFGANGPFDLAPSTDVDWYEITFASPGVAEFYFGNLGYSGYISYYDSNGTYLQSSGACDCWVDIQVAAGTYYVQISSDYWYGGSNIFGYTIEVAFAAPIAASSNIDATHATALAEGKAGPFSLYMDQLDWYSYDADVPGTLDVVTEGPRGGPQFYVVDAYNQSYGSSGCCYNYSGQQYLSATVDVGTYYIVVYLVGYSLVMPQYNISIIFTPWVSNDGNDFRSQAQPLTSGLNGPYELDSSDNDWYYFDTNDTGEGNIQIPGEYNSSMTFFLYNATGAEIGYGSCCPPSVTRSFAAGRYFVRVSQYYYYYQGSYTIDLTKPDSTPPAITILSPADGAHVDAWSVSVTGQTEPGARLSINGLNVTVNRTGAFSYTVLVPIGLSNITIVAADAKGNEATSILTLYGVDPRAALLDEIEQLHSDLANLTAQVAALQAQLTASQADAEAAHADAAAQANATAAANASLQATQSELDRQNGTVAALQASASGQAAMTFGAFGVAAAAVVAALFLAVRQKKPPAKTVPAVPEARPPAAGQGNATAPMELPK